MLAVGVLKDQHFPIDVDISGARDSTACWLVQYGYVTLYSPYRKIPLFGAEKLEKGLLHNSTKVDASLVCIRTTVTASCT